MIGGVTVHIIKNDRLSAPTGELNLEASKQEAGSKKHGARSRSLG